MFKSHDKAFKSTCLSATVSALFGITEPSMFGVNLPRKRPLLAVCVGGGIGGVIAGLSGVQATAFAFPSLAALPIFFGHGFVVYLGACLAGLLVAFLLTMVLKFRVDNLEETVEAEPSSSEVSETVPTKTTVLV